MAFITSNQCVNLEIQDYVIRFASAKKKKNLFVTNFGEHFIPPGIVENGKIVDKKQFDKVLKTCVKKWKLRGKNLHFIAPDSSVIIRTIDVSKDIEDEELTGHIYFELGHSIHLPFENPVVDAVAMEQNSETKKVLLIASSEEVIDAYYDEFKGTRLNPVVADVSPLCQYRLFHHFDLTNDEDIYLLAHFNVKSVTLSIFEKHKPVFMEEVTVPYEGNAWEIVASDDGGRLEKEQFNRDKVFFAFDEIFTEIERIFRFYQFSLNNGDKEINGVLLTGDHPFLYELLDGLKLRVDIPIQTLDPNKIQTGKDLKLGSQYFNVIGLALREGV
jgi:type IV pilus assembly protein PilM